MFPFKQLGWVAPVSVKTVTQEEFFRHRCRGTKDIKKKIYEITVIALIQALVWKLKGEIV